MSRASIGMEKVDLDLIKWDFRNTRRHDKKLKLATERIHRNFDFHKEVYSYEMKSDSCIEHM